jgi:hypothetical protein
MPLAVVLLAVVGIPEARTATAQQPATLALLPFENVSGHVLGQRLIMPVVERALIERGYRLVDRDRLEAVLQASRIRNTGRLSQSQLAALRRETGAETAVVGAVAIFNDSPANPQWGLVSRMLAADSGAIVWTGAAGLTGDDFTHALGLGTITSAERLAEETVKALLRDLPRAGQPVSMRPAWRLPLPRFLGPRASYRSSTLDSDPPRRVVVLPFENASERKGAARIVTDVFTSVLARRGRFEVVESGTVSEALVAIGAAPYGNLDFETLAALRRTVEFDAVIFGTVYSYSEGIKPGATTSPQLTFDARMLDAASGRVLWVAERSRAGDDSRIVLEFGKIRAMVPLVTEVARAMLETL